MKAAVALVSGMDSGILVSELMGQGWTVFPLYVRCGFRWEAAELSRLRRLLRALRGPRLRPLTVSRLPLEPLMGGHWSLTGRGVPGAASRDEEVGLPGRNVFLLAQAWLWAARRGAQAVALGALKGNPFPDATPRFFAAAERALNLAFASRVRLLTPYRALGKRELPSRAPGFPLALAFSCLSPRRGRPCGRCNKCAELAALRRAA